MQAPIRNLNERVLSTNKTDAIESYIKASYNTPLANITLNAINYNENATVNNWNELTPVNTVVPRDFYLQVVGPTCRTCHVARSNSGLRFDTKEKFSNNVFPSTVCGLSKYMPNAKVTFVNFWTSQAPHRPDELRKWFALGTCN